MVIAWRVVVLGIGEKLPMNVFPQRKKKTKPISLDQHLSSARLVATPPMRSPNYHPHLLLGMAYTPSQYPSINLAGMEKAPTPH